MREIKFRAWDRVKQVYIAWDDILDDFWWYSTNSDRYILEQFTGLHDKNGKEIYEGDIIKSINRDEYFDEVKVTNKIELVESLNKYIETLFWIPCHGEIIGNIHENPELLEK